MFRVWNLIFEICLLFGIYYLVLKNFMSHKILFATGIFPPDIGGPATMLAHLAQDLTERGFEVKIITYGIEAKERELQPASPAGGRENTQSNDYRVYWVKKNNKLKYFWQMRKLAKWADLIYATDTYSVGYFAYLIKKLTGQKYILRFTGDSAWETARTNSWTEDYIVGFNTINECHPEAPHLRGEGSRGICRKINKLKARRNKILFNADKIIVDCEFNKKLAKIILNSRHSGLDPESKEILNQVQDDKKDKVIIINNAVDFKDEIRIDEKEMARIKKEIGENLPIILTACRLTPWKGVDKIIEILPELKQKIGAVKFLVMGEGSEMENLKLKVKNLKLKNDVIFLGKIPHAETYNYFKAADVFILNSQYEGASHALLDAMSAGVPILASNVGGNPELIENGVNGFLFEYNNKKEILENLEKVLTDAELRKKISLTAEEKVKKFSWEGVVEKTIRVIKSLGK